MEAKDIDNLIEAFMSEDYDVILSMAGIDIDKIDDIDRFSSYNSDVIFQKIMKNIESGDFDYFKSKGTSDRRIDRIFFKHLAPYSSDKNFIMECIQNRKRYRINKSEIKLLIAATKDADFIKKCIEDRKTYKFSGSDVEDLIEATQDTDFIKKCISECIHEPNKYKISMNGLRNLIISTNDPKYIETIVDKRKKIGLSVGQVTKLIEATHDTEYIKKCVRNRHKFRFRNGEIISMITSTNDFNYIKSFIDESDTYGFSGYDIRELVLKLKDEDVTKKVMEKRFEYGLTSMDIVDIVKNIKNSDLVRKCIKERKEYGFSNKDLEEMIESVGDQDLTKECIDNGAKYGLKKDNLIELAISIKNIEYFRKDTTFSNKKKIRLPKRMTFGVEIESEGEHSRSLKRFNVFPDGWRRKRDGSLTNGIEVVSPVLRNDGDRGVNDIYNICKILNICGQHVSDRCGGHVHIGADYLTSIESWQNLITIWSNTEDILYLISNKEGEPPRGSIKFYAKPISKEFEEAIENKDVQLDTEEDVKEFCKEVQKHRYYGINFKNLGKSKNTVEFRLANGSIDPDTWIENINLFGGIIRASEDLTFIQGKTESERTNNEKELVGCFEKLKDSQIRQDEKLDALLKLIIPADKDRDIYKKRYITNAALLADKPNLQKELEDARLDKPLDLKSVGKAIFYGKDRVNGVDYMQIEKKMKKNIEKLLTRD